MPMDAVIDDRESPKPEDEVHQEPHHSARFLHVPAQPPSVSQQLTLPGYPPNPTLPATLGAHKLERGDEPTPQMQFNPTQQPTSQQLRPSSLGQQTLLGKKKRIVTRKIVRFRVRFTFFTKRGNGNIINEL